MTDVASNTIQGCTFCGSPCPHLTGEQFRMLAAAQSVISALKQVADVIPSEKAVSGISTSPHGIETRMYAFAFGRCKGIAKDALARLSHENKWHTPMP